MSRVVSVTMLYVLIKHHSMRAIEEVEIWRYAVFSSAPNVDG